MDEEWRVIEKSPGYQVSSEGRIRALARQLNLRNKSGTPYTIRLSARPMTVYICRSTGYAKITLAKRNLQLVHRLVAEAFIPNPLRLPQVNHKNGKRADNRVDNLEWVTASENVLHAFHVLGRDSPHAGKFSGMHPTSKAVVATCIRTGSVTVYDSAMDAVRVGFDSGCISRCCSGSSAYHKGYSWRFLCQD